MCLHQTRWCMALVMDQKRRAEALPPASLSFASLGQGMSWLWNANRTPLREPRIAFAELLHHAGVHLEMTRLFNLSEDRFFSITRMHDHVDPSPWP
jgi:hypothetical protein